MPAGRLASHCPSVTRFRRSNQLVPRGSGRDIESGAVELYGREEHREATAVGEDAGRIIASKFSYFQDWLGGAWELPVQITYDFQANI